MLGKEFVDRKVFAQGMDMIGQVKDISVDATNFTVTDFMVQLEKEAGRKIFGERFLFSGAHVKIPVSIVDKLGDVVSLKYSVDQLKNYVVKL